VLHLQLDQIQMCKYTNGKPQLGRERWVSPSTKGEGEEGAGEPGNLSSLAKDTVETWAPGEGRRRRSPRVVATRERGSHGRSVSWGQRAAGLVAGGRGDRSGRLGTAGGAGGAGGRRRWLWWLGTEGWTSSSCAYLCLGKGREVTGW
jgi:hypothetical protein